MTRSKPSLRNPASIGLSLALAALFTAGCSYSVPPTFQHEDIAESVVNICQKEHGISVKTRLVGQTLWIYLPLEEILETPKKPEKYSERFEILKNEVALEDQILKLDYSVKAIIPELEKVEEVVYKKSALEAKHKVTRALLRVLLSSKHRKETSPLFFCIITADIKYGFIIKDLFYYHDFQKFNYNLMSVGEFQHRDVQDSKISPEIIGDKEGESIEYKDVTMGEFVRDQIAHRIKVKFQKPEVGKKADIDKEVIKIVENAMRAYDFQDFYLVELNNGLTQNKIILNQAAIFNRPIEKKF